MEEIINIFIRSFCDARKKANDPHMGRDPQVENHCSRKKGFEIETCILGNVTETHKNWSRD